MQTIDTALALTSLGYHVVPLRPRTKFPEDKNFLEFRISPNEVSRYFDTAREWNIGVLLGTEVRPGACLLAVDIDLEDQLFISRVKSALPGDPLAKKGRKGVTFIMRTVAPVKSASYSRKDAVSGKRYTVIDLLGTGKQTVIPPSIHPTGVPYMWLTDRTLENTAIEDLPLADEWTVFEIKLAVDKPDSPWFMINDMAWHGVGKGGSVDDSLLRASGAMVEAGAPDDFIFVRVRRAVDEMLRVHGRADWNDDVYERRLRNLVEDARKKGFDTGSKKKVDRILLMAEQFIAAHGGLDNLRRLPNGQIRQYEDGHWPPLTVEDLEVEIGRGFRLQAKDIDAVIRTTIKHLSPWSSSLATRKIRLTNGTYDPMAGSFSLDGSPDDYLLYRLPFEYDAKATCHVYEKFVMRAFKQKDDGERTADELEEDQRKSVQCFEEFVALTMFEDLQFQKCLMIIGAPDTGKSTMGHLTRMLHHPFAVGVTDIANLANERTRTSMIGKLVALSNEVSSMSQVADDMFKAIIGGDAVITRRLYEEEVLTVLPARIIIIGNDAFRFSDDSTAIEKRLLYLRCDERVPEDEIDRGLLNKMRAELPGIFNRMMLAMTQLYARGRFDPPLRSKKNIVELGNDNNSIYQFLTEATHQGIKMTNPEYEMPNGVEARIESVQVYIRYAEWAKANGYKQMNNVTFGKRLTQLGFPSTVKWIGGRPIKCRALTFMHDHKSY